MIHWIDSVRADQQNVPGAFGKVAGAIPYAGCINMVKEVFRWINE